MDSRKKSDSCIFNTYARYQKTFVSGKGCTLFDDEKNSYTDFLAGIAVCNLGHSHPAVAQTLARQAEQLVHVSNLFYTVPQAELAAMLVAGSFGDRVFFSNSGAEANEAAIKLARRYFSRCRNSKRFRIITMENSFHGRTMATLSATGQEKIKDGFHPLLEGFWHVPFNDTAVLNERIDETVCAVMLEPVQGEGGVIPAERDFLKNVRAVCDDRDILLIFDEIQTGMGRCGRLFAYEEYGVEPDIMTLAKALGNGLPIGATVASEKVKEGLSRGSHASTFGGTPLVSSVAAEVLKIISQEAFLKEVREKGAYFREKLNHLKEMHGIIKEVRGMGLLNGVEIDGNAAAVVDRCMEKGFIINAVQGNVLRFAPPLIIDMTEIDRLAAALDTIFAREM